MAAVGGYVPIHELNERTDGTSVDLVETLLPLLLSHDEAATAQAREVVADARLFKACQKR